MIGFGQYGMAQVQAAITSLTDNRLVKIDPQAEGFFDAVLDVRTLNEDINLFIEAIKEVKLANLEAFYKPIYDPSEGSKEIPIIYKEGCSRAFLQMVG